MANDSNKGGSKSPMIFPQKSKVALSWGDANAQITKPDTYEERLKQQQELARAREKRNAQARQANVPAMMVKPYDYTEGMAEQIEQAEDSPYTSYEAQGMAQQMNAVKPQEQSEQPYILPLPKEDVQAIENQTAWGQWRGTDEGKLAELNSDMFNTAADLAYGMAKEDADEWRNEQLGQGGIQQQQMMANGISGMDLAINRINFDNDYYSRLTPSAVNQRIDAAMQAPDFQQKIAASLEQYRRTNPNGDEQAYVKNVIVPGIQRTIYNKYVQSNVSKNTLEYLMTTAVRESLTGKILDMAFATKEQREAWDEATRRYKDQRDRGASGFAENLASGAEDAAAMGLAFATDAPLFELGGAAAGGLYGAGARGVAAKVMGNRWMQAAGHGALNLGMYSGASGLVETINSHNKSKSTEEAWKNLGEDLTAGAKGFAEGAITGTAMGLAGRYLDSLTGKLWKSWKWDGGRDYTIPLTGATVNAKSSAISAINTASKLIGQSGVMTVADIAGRIAFGDYKRSVDDDFMSQLGNVNWLEEFNSKMMMNAVLMGKDAAKGALGGVTAREPIRFTNEEVRAMENAGMPVHTSQQALDYLRGVGQDTRMIRVFAHQGEQMDVPVASRVYEAMNNKQLSREVRNKICAAVGAPMEAEMPVADMSATQMADGTWQVTESDVNGRTVQHTNFNTEEEAKAYIAEGRNQCEAARQSKLGEADMVRRKITAASMAARYYSEDENSPEGSMADYINVWLKGSAKEGKGLSEREADMYDRMKVMVEGLEPTVTTRRTEALENIAERYGLEKEDVEGIVNKPSGSRTQEEQQIEGDFEKEWKRKLGGEYNEATTPEEYEERYFAGLLDNRERFDAEQAGRDLYAGGDREAMRQQVVRTELAHERAKQQGTMGAMKEYLTEKAKTDAMRQEMQKADEGARQTAEDVVSELAPKNGVVTLVKENGSADGTQEGKTYVVVNELGGQAMTIPVALKEDGSVDWQSVDTSLARVRKIAKGAERTEINTEDIIRELMPEETANRDYIESGEEPKDGMLLKDKDGQVWRVRSTADNNGWYLTNEATGEMRIGDRQEVKSMINDAEREAMRTEYANRMVEEARRNIQQEQEGKWHAPLRATEVPERKLPMDENGRVIWEQAPVEDTVANLSKALGDEQLLVTLRNRLTKLEGDLKTAQNVLKNSGEVEEVTDAQAQLDEVQRKIDYWKAVQKVVEGKMNMQTAERAAKPKGEEKPEPFSYNPGDQGDRESIGKIASAIFSDMQVHNGADEWLSALRTQGGRTEETMQGGERTNGFLDKETGKIHINGNSVRGVNWAFGHESLHRVKEELGKDSEEYKNLRDAVLEALGEEYVSRRLNSLRGIDVYKGLTDEDLKEEIVADMVGEVFSDSTRMKYVANRLAGNWMGIQTLGRMWQSAKDAVSRLDMYIKEKFNDSEDVKKANEEKRQAMAQRQQMMDLAVLIGDTYKTASERELNRSHEGVDKAVEAETVEPETETEAESSEEGKPKRKRTQRRYRATRKWKDGEWIQAFKTSDGVWVAPGAIKAGFDEKHQLLRAIQDKYSDYCVIESETQDPDGGFFVEFHNWNLPKPVEHRPGTKAYEKALRHEQTLRRRIDNRANEIADKLNIRLVVHHRGKGLTAKQKKSRGWYDVDKRTVHVNADEVLSLYDLQATILHEAIAHHGLRELVGNDRMEGFLQAVVDKANDQMGMEIARIAKDNRISQTAAAEEYLGMIAEDMGSYIKQNEEGYGRSPEHVNGYKTVWENIKELLTAVLKDLGFAIRDKKELLTDDELRYILQMSYKNLKAKKGLAGSYKAEREARDRDYMEAVESGDVEAAQEMLDEKLRERMAGGEIVPFVAVESYQKGRELAHGIKDGDTELTKEAAARMANLVPNGALLVPMPGHTGQATTTLDLTKMIANACEADGKRVAFADGLYGKQRQSQYEAKQQGKSLTADEMGMESLLNPLGVLGYSKVFIIDNVVATGTTAKAAVDAMRKTGVNATVLALAYSGNTKDIPGLKNAEAVTRDAQGNVIPLSERLNEKVRDVNFSKEAGGDSKTATFDNKSIIGSDESQEKDVNLRLKAQFLTAEAKKKSEEAHPEFARPGIAYLSDASRAGVKFTYDDLAAIPEIVEAQKKVDGNNKEYLKITDIERRVHAAHLLDGKHGSFSGRDEKGNETFNGEVEQGRKALFIIGRPAGGKSSVYANPLSEKFKARIIDSDTVKEWLQGFDGGDGAGYVQRASDEVAREALDIATERGDNVVIPKIGGKTILKQALDLKSKGYDLQLYYNDVPAEVSMTRSMARFAEKGRFLDLKYLDGIDKKSPNPTEVFRIANGSLYDIAKYLAEDEIKNNEAQGKNDTHYQNILKQLDYDRQRSNGEARGEDEQLNEGAVESNGRVSTNAEREGVGKGNTQNAPSGRKVSVGDKPLFSYTEWKNNDVKFGEKPKMVWNSESGEPLATVGIEDGDVTKGRNFKKWFGDWEKDPDTASKVVDEDGKPLVLAHGTPYYGFTVFDTRRNQAGEITMGSHFGSREAAEDRLKSKSTGKNRGIYNVYLNIKNPWECTDWFDMNDPYLMTDLAQLALKHKNNAKVQDMWHIIRRFEGWSKKFTDEQLAEGEQMDTQHGLESYEEDDMGTLNNFTKAMVEAAGYDGIKYWNDAEGNGYSWIAFSPEQIKSADITGRMANNGNYSESKDIRFSKEIDPRRDVTKVRGGWNEKKIIKYLKNHPTRSGVRLASKAIAEFDNIEDLKQHMFYHGTVWGGEHLKPSITFSDRELETYGGGGYGDRYWGISVSKNKKIASRFSGTSRDVRIYPMVLLKNAKVIEGEKYQDAYDLGEDIVKLWDDGVDAVWIGDKDKGEEELCVINPAAIVNVGTADFYKVYQLGTQNNPIRIADDAAIDRMYETAKVFANMKMPSKPSRFYVEDGELVRNEDGSVKMKPEEQYQKEMQEYEQSEAKKRYDEARLKAQRDVMFSREVKVTKDEYAKIADNIATYPNKADRGHVFTENNYYLCTDIDKDGNFKVRAALPIAGNEDIINGYRKDSKLVFIPIEDTESVSDIAKDVRSRGGRVAGILPASKRRRSGNGGVYSVDVRGTSSKRGRQPGADGLRDPNVNISNDVTPEMDAEYLKAVEDGDLEKAQRMVNEVARKRGYNSKSDYQGSLAFNGAAPSQNGYFETKEERKQAFDDGDFEDTMSLGDYIDNGVDNWDLEWQINNPVQASGRDKATMASLRNLKSVVDGKKRTIKMYRAVDSGIKEGSFRNGDWITPSKEYAEEHIKLQDWKKGRVIEQDVNVDDIWWDGNDPNEWGYDDGKGYDYKNTKNNRKLADAVTYDDEGNVIPLSQRFNESKNDVRYSQEAELKEPEPYTEEEKVMWDELDKANRILRYTEKNYDWYVDKFNRNKQGMLERIQQGIDEEENPETKAALQKMYDEDEKKQPLTREEHAKLLADAQETHDRIKPWRDRRLQEWSDYYDAKIEAENRKYEEEEARRKQTKPEYKEFTNEEVAENKRVLKEAKKEFGTTNDFREAGYILTDGTMLDFSEKNNGGPAGKRTLDHRAIGRVENGDGWEALTNFLHRGNIRIMPESGTINLGRRPTNEQLKVLGDFTRKMGGDVTLEFFDDNRNSEHTAEYNGASEQRIKADIKKYFDDGIRPSGDVVFSKESETDVKLEESHIQYSKEERKDVLDELEKGKTVKVYRAVRIGDDGKIYSPMAGGGVGGQRKSDRVLTYNPTFGEWEKADEHPELAIYNDGDEYGHVYIDKGEGNGSLKVAYNPYIHASYQMLNDQFSSAWHRPNLAVMEVEVPMSELTSGYKADKAKNSVGETQWTDGVVARQLPEGKKRTVVLSRWDKPIRIVPVEEYAKAVAEQLDGTDVKGIPFNTVTPEQRDALVKAGVNIIEPEKKAGEDAMKAYEEWKNGGGEPDGGVRFSQEKEEERGKSDLESIRKAIAATDTNPTEAQKKSGNYKMGHAHLDGYELTIENPAGSVRRGTDPDGKKWETKMHYTYGYIRGTRGVDGDHIDIFLSENPTEGKVYVVDQVDPKTGKFDEHKVMYGFNSEEEAKAAYLSNYEEGWQGLGNITEVSKKAFRKWIDNSLKKTKPFCEYKEMNAEYQKNVARQIDDRIAELHNMEQSSISNTGNDPDSNSNGEHNPEESGVDRVIPGAKVGKKIYNKEYLVYNLANFIDNIDKTAITGSNFAKRLVAGAGVIPNLYDSDYAAYKNSDGDIVRMRISDHQTNALSLIKKGGRVNKGYSIVIRTPDSLEGKFKVNGNAAVTEFVYKNPDGKTLVNIAKSVFGLIDRGEYVDLADADEISYSPRDRENASLISFSKEADIKSENFKRWFGDWEKDPEKASKVVDEKGEPLVVYHGSRNYGFTVFNTSKEWNHDNIGSHFGEKNTADDFADEGEIYKVYLNIRKPWKTWDFFADALNNAYLDAADQLAKDVGTKEARRMFEDRVGRIYPNVPKDLFDSARKEGWNVVFDNDEGLESNRDMNSKSFSEHRETLVNLIDSLLDLGGYDGMKYENWYEGDHNNECWVVRYPEQIKSAENEGAMANNGNYNPENPDIRYSQEPNNPEWKETMRMVKGKDSEAERMLRELEPRTVEEVASQVLAGGGLLWEDYDDNGKVLKGVKSMMGWKEGERRNFMSLFKKREDGGVSLEKAGEAVIQACREWNVPIDESDAMVGVNALQDVLGSVRTAGELTHYIENERVQQVRDMLEENERRAAEDRDEWYQEQYGMTYEDYQKMRQQQDKENQGSDENDKRQIDWLKTRNERQAEQLRKIGEELQQLKIDAVSQAAYQSVVGQKNMSEEQRKELEAELKAQKTQMGTLKGNQTRYAKAYRQMREVREKLVNYIREQLASEDMPYISKSELNSLLRRLQTTNRVEDLESAYVDVQNVTNKGRVRHLESRLERLMDLKIQGFNGKRMSVAKTVDDSTRRIIMGIRSHVGDMELTGLEEQMDALVRERREKRGEINELQGMLKEETNAAKRTFIQRDIDEKEAEWQSLSEQIDKKADEIDDIRSNKRKNSKVDVKQDIQELEEKAALAAEGTEKWTEEDAERLTALRAVEIINEGKEADSNVRKLNRDISAKIDELTEMRNQKRDPLDIQQVQEDIDRMKSLKAEALKAQGDAVQKAVDTLNDLMDKGRNNLKEQVDADIMHSIQVRRGAFSDLRGGRTLDLENPADKADKNPTVWNKATTEPLYSFEWLCKSLNRRGYGTDSYLYRYFIKGKNGVMEAYNTQQRGLYEDMEQLNRKVTEIFGTKNSKGFGTDAWVKQAAKADEVVEHSGVSRVGEDGRRYEIPMSKGQAAYVYAVNKMSDGHDALFLHGWDNQSMKETEDFIGPEYKELVDWLQKDFLTATRAKYNERYKEMYHTSMARIDNYIPLRRDPRVAGRTQSAITGDNKSAMRQQIEEKAKALITRTVNTLPIDYTQSIFDVITNHIKEQETWYAYAPVRRDLAYLLDSKFFKNTLNAQHPGAFKRFEDSAFIVTQSDQSMEAGHMDDILGKFNKLVVGQNIAWRFATALKQLYSAPAYLGYAQNPEYWMYLIKNCATGLLGRNWQWSRDNIPSFRRRVDTGDLGDYRLSEDNGEGRVAQAIQKYLSMGMIPNRIVDGITCSIGAKAIYDYNMAKAKREIEHTRFETPEEKQKALTEARRVALMEADIFYNETQQSSHPAFLSDMQKSRSLLDRCFTAYQNSNIGYTRMMLTAARDFIQSWKVREMLDYYTDRYMEEQGLDEEDAENAAQQHILKQFGGSMARLCVFGWLLKKFWDVGSTGFFGFLTSDDDEKKKDDETESEYKTRTTNLKAKEVGGMMATPFQGMPLANIALNLMNGRDISPVLFLNEIESLVDNGSKVADQQGLVSKEMMGLVISETAKMGGVNLETLGNIYFGVEQMVKDGVVGNAEDAKKMINLMYFLNTPKKGMADAARNLYKDESLEEYVKKVALARRYMTVSSLEGSWMPWIKPAEGSKFQKEYADLQKEWEKAHPDMDDQLEQYEEITGAKEERKNTAKSYSTNVDYDDIKEDGRIAKVEEKVAKAWKAFKALQKKERARVKAINDAREEGTKKIPAEHYYINQWAASDDNIGYLAGYRMVSEYNKDVQKLKQQLVGDKEQDADVMQKIRERRARFIREYDGDEFDKRVNELRDTLTNPDLKDTDLWR